MFLSKLLFNFNAIQIKNQISPLVLDKIILKFLRKTKSLRIIKITIQRGVTLSDVNTYCKLALEIMPLYCSPSFFQPLMMTNDPIKSTKTLVHV